MKKLLSITLIGLLAIGLLVGYQLVHFSDHKAHLVFCDVGQGDGILLITASKKHILFDTGPDKKILACLSRHLPFWDRTIDLVVLSHPHFDHFMGLWYLLDTYTIKSFATEKLDNPVVSYQSLLEKIKAQGIPTRFVSTGDLFRLTDGVILHIDGPSKQYLLETSPNGKIGENKEFASVLTQIRYGKFSALLTGDSQTTGISDALSSIALPIDILQVPHHGSATGLNDEVLGRLLPRSAIISVGFKNRYGHPTNFTLSLLKKQQIPYERTDQQGDIEIVSDGKTWQMVRR